MSLAGITISIGILVDQAIVMTENATHHLKDHFGDRKGHRRHSRAGDRALPHGRPADLLLRDDHAACRSSRCSCSAGREGKLFHPLAFTKSFAMIGVALISVTLVPALDSDVHQRPLAQRGRELDRPQLHQYLQAAADLGPAAAESGDVDVRRAVDPGGRHVSPAGDHRARGVARPPGERRFWACSRWSRR